MQPATPWRRLMCVAYEGVLLFGVLFFFGYGFSALTQFKGQSGALQPAFQIFVLLVLAAYFGWLWSEGRRTLPMKTMMVVMVDAQGRPLTRLRAVWRFAVCVALLVAVLALIKTVHAAAAVLLLLPLAWSLFDRQHRTLQDVLAGTAVLHAPPPQARTQSTK